MKELFEPENRKEAIKNVAIKTFLVKGFSKARMDDIAYLFGMSKPMVYEYFRSKNELYYSILLDGLKLLNERLAAVCNPKMAAKPELKRMFSRISEFLLYQPEYRGVFSVYFKLHNIIGISDELRRELGAELEKIKSLIYSCLRVSQSGGGIKNYSVDYFFGVCYMMELVVEDLEKEEFLTFFQVITDIVLSGITVR